MKVAVRTSLIFLTIAANLGIILRLMQSGISVANYKYLLHTHSHVALIGWVYNAAFILLQRLLNAEHDRRFSRLFWATQITVIGMLVSFPFQGYGAVSITFSTLYIFCSYYLVYLIFQCTSAERSTQAKFLRWGGVYLVLSSAGPFALGYFMAKGLGDSIWYHLSIYWFLHFLYNGFFVFVIFAHLTKEVPRKGNRIFLLMNGSLIPLFALSALWIEPHLTVYAVAAFGTVLQFFAFLLLILERRTKRLEKSFHGNVVSLALIAYSLKVTFQATAILRPVQDFINTTTPYSVIGFIHLVMLGFFTLFFLAYFIHNRLMPVKSAVKAGMGLLLIGIILSESLLFGQSLLSYFSINWLPNFFEWLAIVSIPISIGILILTVASFAGKISS